MTTKKEEPAVEAEVVDEKTKDCCSSKVVRRDRGGLFWGFALVAVGGILIAETFVDINLWQYFWPGVIVLLGLSLIIRSSRG